MPPPEIVILRKPTVLEQFAEHLQHTDALLVAALREIKAAKKCYARLSAGALEIAHDVFPKDPK